MAQCITYDEKHTNHGDFTVYIEHCYGWASGITPIAIAVTNAIAKSIKRHFDKILTYHPWNDTGDYCGIVSRTWCTNHEDFEREYDPCKDI